MKKKQTRNYNLQVANFVGCDNYSGEPSSVFDDCNTVYFFQPFIDDTSSANVCKPCLKLRVDLKFSLSVIYEFINQLRESVF